MNRHAVIMAGGSGTRLWPLSRRGRPKQLLRIVGGKSLLRLAYERLTTVVPSDAIHVIALAEHAEAIHAELPKLPAANFIGEPMPRDTANAVALSAAILHRRDPQTVMGIFTADHLIRPIERFSEIVQRGFEAAEQHPDALITFGVRPTRPETGYGYVQRGEPAGDGIWRVQRFREKPDARAAAEYVASGEYAWNSGMFVWRTAAILDQVGAHLSATRSAIEQIAAAWETKAGRQTAAELYPALRKVSIDHGVMEKAPRVLMLEMDLEWIDIGSWTALSLAVGTDADGNTVSAPNAAMHSSRNNVIVSEDDHLIVTIGVEDLVIVHSPDATLICRKDEAQRIKDVSQQLDDRYR